MAREETAIKQRPKRARATRRRAVSPIGQSVSGSIAEKERRDEDFRRERERLRPFEDLARLVIGFRLDQGLTQKQLADLVGTSHSAISRIESGQHATTLTTVERLARALGKRVSIQFVDA